MGIKNIGLIIRSFNLSFYQRYFEISDKVKINPAFRPFIKTSKNTIIIAYNFKDESLYIVLNIIRQ